MQIRPTLRPILILAASAAALLVLGAGRAEGHPHEWIDLRVSLLFDRDKRLVGLEQSWLFDPFFSAYVVDALNDERPKRSDVREQAEAIAPEMVSNLHQHGYLNEWTFDGQRLDGLNGRFVSTRVTRGQMELTFQIDLGSPLDLSTGDFEYRVFDPTYFIEILHAKGHRPRLKGAARGCRARIIEPEPNEDLMVYAADLDRDENPDDGLGTHFAERVVVSCPR